MLLFTRLRLIACLGALSGVVWAGTYATFSDEATGQSAFTAGTVNVVLDSEIDDEYSFSSLTVSAMKPGDVKYAPLTIANDGSIDFTYSMATSATNADTKALRDQLTLEIKKVAATGDCTQAGFDASVTSLAASGALSSRAIASRSLAASASEVACFKVTLPSTAGDAYQGATTTATFTFSATQA